MWPTRQKFDGSGERGRGKSTKSCGEGSLARIALPALLNARSRELNSLWTNPVRVSHPDQCSSEAGCSRLESHLDNARGARCDRRTAVVHLSKIARIRTPDSNAVDRERRSSDICERNRFHRARLSHRPGTKAQLVSGQLYPCRC